MKNRNNIKIKFIEIIIATIFLQLLIPLSVIAEEISKTDEAMMETNIFEKYETIGQMGKENINNERGTEEVENVIIFDEEATSSNAEEIIVKKAIAANDIGGTWSVDGVTTYYFDIDGNGAMILPEHKYTFKYTIESDKLLLKFDKSSIGEILFIPSIKDDTLTLERVEEVGVSKYTLKKQKKF